MSENKKYYYLKFKEDYFNQDPVKVIEAMENGYIYSLIILKLYLKSLKWEGQLKINESIPYMKNKIDLLAKVINHDPDHVARSINLAKELGIIEILNSGEIFMSDIQSFIGKSSSEADRKQIYREKINEIEAVECKVKRVKDGQMSQECPENVPKMSGQSWDNSGTFSDKRTPELELELDLERERKREKERKSAPTHKKSNQKIKPKKEKYFNAEFVTLTEKELISLNEKYGEKKTKSVIEILDIYIGSKGDKYKSHYHTLLGWPGKEFDEQLAKNKKNKKNNISDDYWENENKKNEPPF